MGSSCPFVYPFICLSACSFQPLNRTEQLRRGDSVLSWYCSPGCSYYWFHLFELSRLDSYVLLSDLLLFRSFVQVRPQKCMMHTSLRCTCILSPLLNISLRCFLACKQCTLLTVQWMILKSISRTEGPRIALSTSSWAPHWKSYQFGDGFKTRNQDRQKHLPLAQVTALLPTATTHTGRTADGAFSEKQADGNLSPSPQHARYANTQYQLTTEARRINES